MVPFRYGQRSYSYRYYDPYWAYTPYLYGGYGYSVYGYPGYSRGYGGSAYLGGGYEVYGGLRLMVQPREAEVFVDGGYVGVVDDFDGVFQRLTLEAGTHYIEIRAYGHETLAFDVRILPGETTKFRGYLQLRP